MSTFNKTRRAALLCAAFTRNLAYYRVGWNGLQPLFPESEIWATINSKFLDIAVLEWCKLFGDSNATHHWRDVVQDPNSLLSQMLGDCGISLPDWDSYIKEMRNYRDKFVAHLDKLPVMDIPKLDWAKSTTSYLFDTIRAENDALLGGLPTSMLSYYQDSLALAKNLYPSQTK